MFEYSPKSFPGGYLSRHIQYPNSPLIKINPPNLHRIISFVTRFRLIHILESHYTEPGHRDIIVTLLNTYACDPMGGNHPLPAETQKTLVDALAKRPHIHTLIAFTNEEPVGLVICIESFSSFAAKSVMNIHDIVVVPKYRNKGIGRQLLQAVEDLAHRLDCCKITLEVLEGNKVAQSLYRKVGFDFYQLDASTGRALFMEKKLKML
jgi:ribosomal protein S18 acetylase RimI-like enzyme